MTTPEKLEQAKNAVGNVLHHHASAYVNGLALRAIHAEKEKHVLFSLTQHPAPYPLNIANSEGHIFNYTRTEVFNEFANIKIALEISEASPAFIEAHALIQPLVDKVRELEAQLLREQEEHAAKVNALREAEEAATGKAQALLEKDPTVQKLRADILATTPAHLGELHDMPKLVRGRIEIPAHTEAGRA